MDSTYEFHIPVKYFSSICRVCLTEQELLMPLQEINFTHNLNSQGSVENVSAYRVFLKHCNVVVHLNDKKPQGICVSCMNAMCMAYNFFELFVQSNTTLERILAKYELENGSKSVLKKNLKPVNPTSNTLSKNNETKLGPASSIAFVETLIADIDEDQIVLLPENISCSANHFLENDIQNSADITKEKIFADEMQTQETLPFCTQALKDHSYYRKKMSIKRKHVREKMPPKPKNPKPVSNQELRKRQQLEKENDIFRCRFCRKTLNGIGRVLEHLQDEHALTRRCILCPRIIKKHMIYHVAAHSKRSFVCKICRLYFEDKESLERHKMEIDHSPALSCGLCNRKFSSLYKKRFHVSAVHGKSSKFKGQCTQCGVVVCKTNLRRHERTHDEPSVRKKYLCQICGNRFTSKYNSDLHIKVVHEGQKHLASRYKNPGYKKKKTPEELEEEQKTYQCQFCPNTFSKQHFFRHCLSHPEYKSVQCPHCGDIFENSDGYKIHRSLAHRSFVCEICDKGFANLGRLTEHKKKHTKPIKCDVCGMECATSMSLITHKRIHTGEKPFQCEYCGKAYRQTSQLRQHLMSNHTQKNFKCELCEKTFVYHVDLRAHMRTHTGEKPFICPYCENRFRDTASRHKHVKRNHPEHMEDFDNYKKKHQEKENMEIIMFEKAKPE